MQNFVNANSSDPLFQLQHRNKAYDWQCIWRYTWIYVH